MAVDTKMLRRALSYVRFTTPGRPYARTMHEIFEATPNEIKEAGNSLRELTEDELMRWLETHPEPTPQRAMPKPNENRSMQGKTARTRDEGE